jgi:AAA ATPase domain
MAGPETDPRFRGRAAEIAVLVEAVEDAAAGRMTSVVVEGEPGIDKSRLLREALTRVRGRGHQVVEAAAEELERTRPFGALADAFGCTSTASDPRRARIAGLLTAGVPGPAAVTVTSDPGLQFQVVDGFRRPGGGGGAAPYPGDRHRRSAVG